MDQSTAEARAESWSNRSPEEPPAVVSAPHEALGDALWRSGLVGGLAVVVAAGSWGARLGFAEDADSKAIYDVLAGIRQLSYQPSRTWGAPLYEIVAAVLDGWGGLWLCNVASLAFTLAGLGALAHLLRRSGLGVRLAAFLAVALHPLVLANASTLMETSLHFALACGLLAAFLPLVEEQREATPARLVLLAGLTGGLLLTRPDGLLLVAGLFTVVALDRHRPLEGRAWLGLALGVGGAVAAATYVGLNDGLGFLSRDVLLADPWLRRLVRAVLGVANVAGVLVVVVAFVGATEVPRRLRAVGWSPVVVLALTVGALWAVRYVALPDELEYLLPAYVVVVVVLARLEAGRTLGALAVSVGLSNLVVVSIFERNVDGLAVAPSVREGGLLQDWRVRGFEQVMRSETFHERLRAELFPAATGVPVRPTYGGTFVGPGNELVVSREALFRWDNPRVPGRNTADYAAVIVCDTPLGLGRGWRLWQPLRSSALLDVPVGELSQHCRKRRSP